jgi:hypothetical protein
MTIDLNRMHHAIHQVSGDMTLRFNKATTDDLARWAKALREIASEMEAPTPEEKERDLHVALLEGYYQVDAGLAHKPAVCDYLKTMIDEALLSRDCNRMDDALRVVLDAVESDGDTVEDIVFP